VKKVRAALHDGDTASALGERVGKRRLPLGDVRKSAPVIHNGRHDARLVDFGDDFDIAGCLRMLDRVRERLSDGEEKCLEIGVVDIVQCGETHDRLAHGPGVAGVGRDAKLESAVHGMR
jgi:hypothetical protein